MAAVPRPCTNAAAAPTTEPLAQARLSAHANREAAFGGESLANRKDLFFAEAAKPVGNAALSKLFRDTAAQGQPSRWRASGSASSAR